MDGDSKEIKQKWEKLADHLNSLGYGQKSIEKWQLAIGRWKSKVKAKATQLRLEMERTGAGPAKCPPLTDLEERLMSLLGWKAVTGDGNKEFGIEMHTKGSIQLGQQIITREMPDSIATSSEVAVSSCAVQPPPLHVLTCNNRSKTLPIHQKKEKTGTKRRIPQSTDKSRKMVSLNQMHCENLQVLKNIQKDTKNLADSVADMRSDFREYINYLKEQ